jgi:cytochrome c oxidase subunit IV
MSHVDPRDLQSNDTRESVELPHGHGPTTKMFIGVWVALLVATGLTVLIATINLGAFSAPIALIIATIKAILVILFFMEIKYQTKMTLTVVLAAFFFLALLLCLTMSDYISRAWNTHF